MGRSERYSFPGATLSGRFRCLVSFENLVERSKYNESRICEDIDQGAEHGKTGFAHAGIRGERVFTDKVSGKNQERPKLRKMMDFVREGDSLTVESISRFARNTRDLLDLTATLDAKGVQFISRKENIDTSTAAGKFMLAVFGALAELERDNILERQAEGIAIAKAEGRMTGRPKKAVDTFEGVYLNVKEGRLSASAGAKQLGISRSTWYRKVREYEDDPFVDL